MKKNFEKKFNDIKLNTVATHNCHTYVVKHGVNIWISVTIWVIMTFWIVGGFCIEGIDSSIRLDFLIIILE